jgi:plasmid stabilization system protein ParE
MSRRIRFHPTAQREPNEAADYYDLEGPGLGSAFLSAVERALVQVRQYPEASPVALAPVRKKLVSGFPYAALYSIVDDTIVVLAIAHLRRRPFYWRNRL